MFPSTGCPPQSGNASVHRDAGRGHALSAPNLAVYVHPPVVPRYSLSADSVSGSGPPPALGGGRILKGGLS